MKLAKARIRNYRSIKDTGEFQIENLKTILVGPNEAGKTVILHALQQLNPPEEIDGFNALRDYPRSLYNDIPTGKVKEEDIEVVIGWFTLEEEDKNLLPVEYQDCTYVRYKYLNNKYFHLLENAPNRIYYKDIKNDLIRLSAHMDKQYVPETESEDQEKPSLQLKSITAKLSDYSLISGETAKSLKSWIEDCLSYVDEETPKENERYIKLTEQIDNDSIRSKVLTTLASRLPVFVLFNNYFKVKPSVHLEHLANRVEKGLLDDKYYDYGNLCLLKLLGFSVRELSTIGKTQSPAANDTEAIEKYRDTLDRRTYQLNAASVKLTKEIKSIWNPNPNRPEAEKIRINADGQYLKVVVEDDLGVEIELDQRSEGFQWLVSFFVVFFTNTLYELRLTTYPQAFEITDRIHKIKGGNYEPDTIKEALKDLLDWKKGVVDLIISVEALESFIILRDTLMKNPETQDAYSIQQVDKISANTKDFRRQLRRDIGFLFREEKERRKKCN